MWAVRHPYVGNTFFDASASAFFLQNVMKETGPRSRSTTRLDHTAAAGKSGSVGPDWIKAFERLATQESKPNTEGSSQPHLDIQFECELGEVRDGDTWPVSALLTNGVRVDCDFVVSATGVVPTTSILPPEFEVRHFRLFQHQRDHPQGVLEAHHVVKHSAGWPSFVPIRVAAGWCAHVISGFAYP